MVALLECDSCLNTQYGVGISCYNHRLSDLEVACFRYAFLRGIRVERRNPENEVVLYYLKERRILKS